MKKSTTGSMIFLALGLLLGACKKELNVYPTTSVVDGDLIKDQASAQVVLNGVYYRFADAGIDDYNVQSTLWSTPNEYVASQMAGTLASVYSDDGLDDFTFDPDNYNVGYTWQYCYALVNAANGFIRNATPVSSIPAAAKQQMMAEAGFLRAFGNSELLLYYGQYNDPSSKYGIILRDEFVTTTHLNLPRTGVAAAYTSILADLDAAIKGLPVLNSAIYYANASAAKLLEARVLINRGAAGDYARVISLTNDIITNGPFAVEDSLKDIFLTKGFSSKEVILGVQPYPNEDYKDQIYLATGEFVPTDSLISLLANDGRRQWVYKTILDYYYDTLPALTKYFSGDPMNIEPAPLNAYSYAFRLSEAYLLEAEAITLSGGDLANAKTLLTTVMSHGGAGAQELAAVADASTPEALQLEIVKENLRNFICENGVDWFALRRLPFTTMQSLNPNITDATRLIWPIPTSELSENNVIQNPGY